MSRDFIVFTISGTEFRLALLKRIAELEPIAKYVNTLNQEIQDNYKAHYKEICYEADFAADARRTAWQRLSWWKKKIPVHLEELKETLAAVDDSRQYQVPMDFLAHYLEEDALREEMASELQEASA